LYLGHEPLGRGFLDVACFCDSFCRVIEYLSQLDRITHLISLVGQDLILNWHLQLPPEVVLDAIDGAGHERLDVEVFFLWIDHLRPSSCSVVIVLLHRLFDSELFHLFWVRVVSNLLQIFLTDADREDHGLVGELE